MGWASADRYKLVSSIVYHQMLDLNVSCILSLNSEVISFTSDSSYAVLYEVYHSYRPVYIVFFHNTMRSLPQLTWELDKKKALWLLLLSFKSTVRLVSVHMLGTRSVACTSH